MPVDMKAMIAETYASLVKEKPLDKVSVRELVDACHISRQTFYYHFKDILDVIEWATRQMADLMLEKLQSADSPQEACRILIVSALDSRAILKKLLESQRKDEINRILFPVMRQYMKNFIAQMLPDLQLSYSDMEAVLNFYAYGMAGLLVHACEEGRADPDKLARQIYLLVSGQMLSLHKD